VSEGSSVADAAALSIITTRLGPASVQVYLAGEIDMATAPRLRAELLAAIAAAGAHTEVLVDLCRVSFIDAIGIGVLIHGSEAARRAGLGFAVANPRGIVLRIIEVLDLVEAFGITPVQPMSPPY
jgi:anti-sigma B factor antagonist